MHEILRDLLLILNEVEVKGKNNLARLYSAMDIAQKLIDTIPENLPISLEGKDGTVDGQVNLE